MRTFAIIGAKGGTGKTLFAASMAHILTKLVRFEHEPPPRVLLVDMDLHVRGLSLLLYRDLSFLERTSITSYTFLEKEISSLSSIAESLNERDIQVNPSISVLPSVNLTRHVNWPKVHQWLVPQVMERMRILIGAAESAGYTVVIFDTRAGPDNISLGAALASDLTLILMEPDKVSFANSIGLRGEIESLKKQITQKAIQPSITRLVFVQNKTIEPYSHETEDVMRDATFLPAIPMDLNFLKKYNRDSDSLVIDGELFNTELAIHMLRTIREGLKETRVQFEILPYETSGRTSSSDSPILDLLERVPPEFTAIIGIFSLLLSGVWILSPQLFGQDLARTFVIAAIFFILMSLYIFLLRRSEARQPRLVLKQQLSPVEKSAPSPEPQEDNEDKLEK